MFRIRIRTPLIAALLALGLGLSSAYAASVEISRHVPAGLTINVLPIEASADVDGDSRVDRYDLIAVAKKLGTRPARGETADINHDGIIDVVDLAIVARYFGLEAQI